MLEIQASGPEQFRREESRRLTGLSSLTSGRGTTPLSELATSRAPLCASLLDLIGRSLRLLPSLHLSATHSGQRLRCRCTLQEQESWILTQGKSNGRVRRRARNGAFDPGFRADSALRAGLALRQRWLRACRMHRVGDCEESRWHPARHPRRPKDCIFGPSVELEMPAMLDDSGVVSPTGDVLKVRVIDCAEEVVGYLREQKRWSTPTTRTPHLSIRRCFDPFGHHGRCPLQTGWLSFTFQKSTRRQISPTYRLFQSDLPPEGLPVSGVPKPKRTTTAALSSQMEKVLGLLPRMLQQLTMLSERQQKIEDQIRTLGKSAAVALAQPLGAALDLPRPSFTTVAKAMPPPPRTNAKASLGLLASPALSKPADLVALEEEKVVHPSTSAQIQGDALAHAVLAQSQALTKEIL